MIKIVIQLLQYIIPIIVYNIVKYCMHFIFYVGSHHR